MKSTLKVAYQDRYGHIKGHREPVIRIELIKTDDPRDTMLEDLVDDNSELGIVMVGHEPTAIVGTPPTFLIYKKSPRDLIGDIAFDTFQTLEIEHGNRFQLVYYSGRYLFSLKDKSECKSNGVMIDDFRYPIDFKTALIKDFKEFHENYLHKMDLETFQKITSPDAAGYHVNINKNY